MVYVMIFLSVPHRKLLFKIQHDARRFIIQMEKMTICMSQGKCAVDPIILKLFKNDPLLIINLSMEGIVYFIF